jgi:hypothetical protein
MDQLGIRVGQIQQETYRQPRFLRFYHSDSISLNNFIASITQEHHLYLYGPTLQT